MHNPIALSNFNLHELISKQVMDLLGSNAWSIFNAPFVIDVDKFVTDLKRDTDCTACIINDWKWGGQYTESGFREYSSGTGASKSQHKLGNAFDLKFNGITIDEALAYLLEHQDKYPHIKRYELLAYTRSTNKYGGWFHLDGKLDEPRLRGIIP